MAATNGFIGGVNWAFTSDNKISWEQESVLRLIKAIKEFKFDVPTLKNVEWKRQNSGNNVYTFEMADGRIWRQNILLFPAVVMDFRVLFMFGIEEFIFHRPVRDLLIGLAITKGLKTFEANWD